jgi:hypothetical protein
MFIRPQPLHLFGLGIEWLTPQRAETVVSTIFMFIRPQPYTCLGIEWLTQGGVVKQASKQAWLGSGLLFFMRFISGPNPCTPVWELNVQSNLFTYKYLRAWGAVTGVARDTNESHAAIYSHPLTAWFC